MTSSTTFLIAVAALSVWTCIVIWWHTRTWGRDPKWGASAIVPILLLCGSVVSDLHAREWTDSTDRFKVIGHCEKVGDDGIHLRKTNGRIVVVPLSRLCEKDREYATACALYDSAMLWVRRAQPARAEELLRGASQHALCSALRAYLIGSRNRGRGLALYDPKECRRIVDSCIEWLQSEQGEPRPAEMLGLLYAYGVGTAQDLDKAVENLSRAAELGSASAKGELAFFYVIGHGVEKSEARAVDLWRAGAEDGDSMSETNLGTAYLSGIGVAKNIDAAKSWFRKASAKNNSHAQALLANVLLDQYAKAEPPQPLGDRSNAGQKRRYKKDIARREKLLHQVRTLARRSQGLGNSFGTLIMARIMIEEAQNTEDSGKTLKEAGLMIERAAKNDCIPALVLVGTLLRSKVLRGSLASPEQDPYALLDKARELDRFGQHTKLIEESAAAWKKKDGEVTVDKAEYERRLATARLVLVDWDWGVSDAESFVEAHGQVKNISNDRLTNITAVVTFFTEDGKFITSDEALISYNPILPGQVSPFKLICTRNPAMSSASIDFKQLLGGSIPWVKQRGDGD
jgi:TPR repeat protein